MFNVIECERVARPTETVYVTVETKEEAVEMALSLSAESKDYYYYVEESDGEA